MMLPEEDMKRELLFWNGELLGLKNKVKKKKLVKI